MGVETLYENYLRLPEEQKADFLALLLDDGDDLSAEWKVEIDKRWELFSSMPGRAIEGHKAEQELATKHGLQL